MRGLGLGSRQTCCAVLLLLVSIAAPAAAGFSASTLEERRALRSLLARRDAATRGAEERTAGGPVLAQAIGRGEPLTAAHIEMVQGSPIPMMVDVERAHILRVLHATGWRIEGVSGAAVTLGLKPSTLRSRMRRLGVRRAFPVRGRSRATRPA